MAWRHLHFISIHAPARGAPRWSGREHRLKDFNPRSREGSDVSCRFTNIADVAFQSTLPRGERQGFSGVIDYFNIISIHAPARGATITGHHAESSLYYFNPRSREGSDAETVTPSKKLSISIHAPARGATLSEPFGILCRESISIHAPARGATIL